jgi:hypothetical protein
VSVAAGIAIVINAVSWKVSGSHRKLSITQAPSWRARDDPICTKEGSIV